MLMPDKYRHEEIETKWHKRWEERETFRLGRISLKGKKYILEMLPYPSGKMHMGHVRNYLLGDVYARYFRMQGFDVVHPMGWDAFGLPAENAAIKDGTHPASRTAENITSFRAEMKALGYSYDWALEVNTSHPSYYRWNQWFFLKMLERDLVYRRFSHVNWCTGCLTVIANEQVQGGICERCESPVQDTEMPEWAFRITRYSQALLDGLQQLTDWPERIVAAQRHWIGRSEGVKVDFQLEGSSTVIQVFTTRLDTIYGCSSLLLAPENSAVKAHCSPAQKPEVDVFIERVTSQQQRETSVKEGVFTGAYALHPFTGARVPVWVANFVLASYGTGALMSVPAHDLRDYEFAKKYGHAFKTVIHTPQGPWTGTGAYTEDGILAHSGPYSGMSSAQARAAMSAWLQREGKGASYTSWRQRDWGFSRQRYWGTPIPIVYCDACNAALPVPYEALPVTLPAIATEKVLTGKGEPPLAKITSWVHTSCPRCNGPARREVDTMDTFVDSCWYYARYLSPQCETAPFDTQLGEKYLPIDIYIGGPEHATMHLLYFRFWSRAMKEMGLVCEDEPALRLITQGIVNGPDGRKMSKRWNNVVSPAWLVQRYGADTVRVYVLFAGPPERDFDWSEAQVEGINRFLCRVWRLAAMQQATCCGVTWDGPHEGQALQLRKVAHKALQRVTQAIERLSFNTAIAGIMEFVNALYLAKEVKTKAEQASMREAIGILCVVLVPFAPHLANEIAAHYGLEVPLEESPWPTFDASLVADDVISYVVQVGGKLRASVMAPTAASEAEVRALAEANPRVRVALGDREVKKFIFVPKRLVNFVV